MDKYESRFSPGKLVSPPQYITELICEKSALQKGVQLPLQFWKHDDYWKKYYQQQCLVATSLCRTYPHSAIVKALRDPGSKWIFSLRNPRLDEIISKYNKAATPDEIVAVEPIDATKTRPVEPTKAKTIKSRLKDL